MASLLIKNIPPSLHLQLKKQALEHRRSLNGETIHILQQSLEAQAQGQHQSASLRFTSSSSETSKPDAYPPEIAAKLQALQELRDGLALRNVDFEEWKQTAANSRR